MGIITKKIGTAGAGRDYSTWQAWEDALPANLVTDANSQVGEGYPDSEFTSAGVLLTIAGQTTSATYTITVRAAAGLSFKDNVNKLTNRLTYNAANGVALSSSITFGAVVQIQTANVFFDGIQVKASSSTGIPLDATAVSPVITNCIFFGIINAAVVKIRGATAKAINCLIINDSDSAGSAIQFESGGAAYNCTAVRPSNRTAGASAFATAYGAATVKNCAVFGFSALTGTYNADGHNVTDAATAPGSTSNLVSKTYATQFTQSSTGSSVEDFRIVVGSDCVNAGARDATNTSDLDIVGQARSTTTPTVGAWEYISSAGVSGTFASTLGGATLAASGSVTNAGSFASSLAGCTLAASGSVGSAPSGAFASTLDGFTIAATGTINDTGAFASTLAGVTMSASGTVAPNVTGSFASTLEGVTMAASESVAQSGFRNRRRILRRDFIN